MFTSLSDDPAFSVWLINADGTGSRRFETALFDIRSPNWSPDGTTLVVARRPGPFNDHADRFDIWTKRFDGSSWRRLTFNTSHSEVPRWSPDGTMIMYSLLVGLRDELHVIAADGTDSRVLPQSTSSDYFAVWRP